VAELRPLMHRLRFTPRLAANTAPSGAVVRLESVATVAAAIRASADKPAAREALMEPRLERAIGVIYAPQTERISHYFEAVLPEQFDAVIHWDETRAVTPLDPPPGWPRHGEAAPDTFPSGL